MGEEVVPFQYDDGNYFSDGLAKVKNDEIASIINKEGKVIVAACDYWETYWSVVEIE
jgi:hypothetical protein